MHLLKRLTESKTNTHTLNCWGLINWNIYFPRIFLPAKKINADSWCKYILFSLTLPRKYVYVVSSQYVTALSSFAWFWMLQSLFLWWLPSWSLPQKSSIQMHECGATTCCMLITNLKSTCKYVTLICRSHIWVFVAACKVLAVKTLHETYSNTELSFWSPQMRISVMERMVSTSRFRLWSVTVVFLVKTWYIYLEERHKWREDVLKRDCSDL